MSEPTPNPPTISVTWLCCLGLSKRHAEAVVASHERENAELRAELLKAQAEKANAERQRDDANARYYGSEATKKLHERLKGAIADRDSARAQLSDAKEQFQKAKEWNQLVEIQVKNLQSIVEDQDNQLADAKADSERIEWLESLLSHPYYWRDLVLCWDHEDGVWISTVQRGDLLAATPMEYSPHQPTLRAAIDAAKEGKK